MVSGRAGSRSWSKKVAESQGNCAAASRGYSDSCPRPHKKPCIFRRVRRLRSIRSVAMLRVRLLGRMQY
ncbi:hypothetical protein EVA_20077 [gut metagenome]|uniref:Uncharacterized protein n=1 Tax=gut metagenome TaxID=749906 RepID=J9FA82_9ZZZZ